MRWKVIVAVALFFASSAQALVWRTVTGTVKDPGGTAVSSGSVTFEITGKLPADTVAGIVAPRSKTCTVSAGALGTCSLAAPAHYLVTITAGTASPWSFECNLAEAGGAATTLQTMYLSTVTLPVVHPNSLVEGDNLLLLTAPSGSTGQVATVQADKTIAWAAPAAWTPPTGTGLLKVTDGVLDPTAYALQNADIPNDFLRVSNAGSGLSGVLLALQDGLGASAPFMLSNAGFALVGAGTTAPLCSLTGVSVQSVSGGVSTLAKTAHGCDLKQGNVVYISSAGVPSNVGMYVYTGLESSAPNTIEIAGTLTQPDTDIALKAYNRAWGWDGDGDLHATARVIHESQSALMLGYDVDLSTGFSQGLELFFGSRLGHWGTDEASHRVMRVYRAWYREGPLLNLDSTGYLTLASSVDAVGGRVQAANLTATAFAASGAPTVTPMGTGGSATWKYKYVALSQDGGHGAASAEGQTTVGNATLNGSNYNRIAVPSAVGVYSFDVYRTASGGTPATTGYIGNVIASLKAATPTYFNDTGLAGNAAAAPTDNTTGTVTAATLSVSGAATINGETNFGANVLNLRNFNGEVLFRARNISTGTGAMADFSLENAADGNSGFNLIVTGTAMTSPGASLPQDGAVITAQPNLSGGMSVSVRGAAAPFRLFTGGSADANQRLLITAVGNVGISKTGAYAPGELLDVNGVVNAVGGYKVNGSAGGTTVVTIHHGLSDTEDCTITYEGGLFKSTTCSHT